MPLKPDGNELGLAFVGAVIIAVMMVAVLVVVNREMAAFTSPRTEEVREYTAEEKESAKRAVVFWRALSESAEAVANETELKYKLKEGKVESH